MTIAVVTDSASQMPDGMAAELGVQVVPIAVTINGELHHEGIDVTPSQFWELFDGDPAPVVSTSQPSPGEIAAVYQRAAVAGAEEIVSIHVGSDVSGTVNAAQQAMRLVDVPVHVIDSGTASFGVAACVWRACEVLREGGAALDVIESVMSVSESIGTSFILQALDFARDGGRLADVLADDADGVMVLAGVGTAVDVVGTGRSVDEVCDLMAARFLASGQPIRAAVGEADPATVPFADGLEARLRASDLVADIVRYQVGPSIGAHTGPGTAGGFWWPHR